MKRLIARALPHLTIILSVMTLVFFVVDGFNAVMAFMASELSKRIFAVLAVCSISTSVMLISRQWKEDDRKARKEQRDERRAQRSEARSERQQAAPRAQQQRAPQQAERREQMQRRDEQARTQQRSQPRAQEQQRHEHWDQASRQRQQQRREDLNVQSRERQREQDQEVLQKWADAGVTVTELTDEAAAEFKDASSGVADLFASEFPDMAVFLPSQPLFLTPLSIAAFRGTMSD